MRLVKKDWLFSRRVILDPSVPLEAQIDKGGYDSVNPRIKSPEFTLTLPAGFRKIDFFELQYDGVDTWDIIQDMYVQDYIGATIDDCLALSEFKEFFWQRVIIFLCAGFREEFHKCNVLALDNQNGKRRLVLPSFNYYWQKGFWFAAIKESGSEKSSK